MGLQTKKLVVVLGELIELLESDGETHWRRWMIEARRRLKSSDYSGIEYLLGAFGGMGSFNDLIICQDCSDGRFAWKDGYREKNDQLSSLRSTAWELASWIRRHHKVLTAEQNHSS